MKGCQSFWREPCEEILYLSLANVTKWAPIFLPLSAGANLSAPPCWNTYPVWKWWATCHMQWLPVDTYRFATSVGGVPYLIFLCWFGCLYPFKIVCRCIPCFCFFLETLLVDHLSILDQFLAVDLCLIFPFVARLLRASVYLFALPYFLHKKHQDNGQYPSPCFCRLLSFAVVDFAFVYAFRIVQALIFQAVVSLVWWPS